MGHDHHTQARQVAEDIDGEHPARVVDQGVSCHSHHLHCVHPEHKAVHKYIRSGVAGTQEPQRTCVGVRRYAVRCGAR